jgi:hypothetical protein
MINPQLLASLPWPQWPTNAPNDTHDVHFQLEADYLAVQSKAKQNQTNNSNKDTSWLGYQRLMVAFPAVLGLRCLILVLFSSLLHEVHATNGVERHGLCTFLMVYSTHFLGFLGLSSTTGRFVAVHFESMAR